LADRQRTPRDATEQQLAKIWESVLVFIRLECVTNSLSSAAVFAGRETGRANRGIRKRLSLAMLFQHQTIEQMAALLREESSRASRVLRW
jgi:hypothetical protein